MEKGWLHRESMSVSTRDMQTAAEYVFVVLLVIVVRIFFINQPVMPNYFFVIKGYYIILTYFNYDSKTKVTQDWS